MLGSIAAMIVDRLKSGTWADPVLPKTGVSTVVVKIGVVGYDASWREAVDRVLNHRTLGPYEELKCDH